jgi:alkanesulfonate monooxygenase SsuD/methylene tetrahydromethanopterin reductase-like flavin-dependent oxidoreductase (luciferase family)
VVRFAALVDRWVRAFPLKRMRSNVSKVGVALPVQEHLTVDEYLRIGDLAESLDFDSVFVGEIAGSEALALMAAMAARTSRVRLASGVVSIYSRTPVLTAMGFATLASQAPGRVIAGIGTGSYVVVEQWHGRRLSAPQRSITEFSAIFRAALAGRRVDYAGSAFQVTDFKLQIPVAEPVPLYFGSFNPAMLKLAGAIADGVILAFCPVDMLPSRIAAVREGAAASGRDPAEVEICSYVNSYVGTDLDRAMERFRRLVLQYAVQPTHRAGFVESFPDIDRATELWRAGERRAALDLVSDETVLRQCPIGDVGTVVDRIETVRSAGVDLPVLFPQSLEFGDSESPENTIRAVGAELARRAAPLVTGINP